MADIPLTYQNRPHPLLEQDKNCTLCQLGKDRERHNKDQKEVSKQEFCVGGAGPDDLSKVKLIVVSDYPGFYEAQLGQPMVDRRVHTGERKNGLLLQLNAGAFLRKALELMYGLDTYKEVWITNAIRCNPGKTKPLDSAHLKPCIHRWLGSDLFILDEQIPKVPCLIAGQYAYKAFREIYKDKTLLSSSLNELRRRSDIVVGRRPCVFTDNPAKAARSEPRIETQVKLVRGVTKITANEWLYPLLPGSPVELFIKDLSCLKHFL